MRLLKECYAKELPINTVFIFQGVEFKVKEKDFEFLGCDVVYDPYGFYSKGERQQVHGGLVVITEA